MALFKGKKNEEKKIEVKKVATATPIAAAKKPLVEFSYVVGKRKK